MKTAVGKAVVSAEIQTEHSMHTSLKMETFSKRLDTNCALTQPIAQEDLVLYCHHGELQVET
jgi:hypothetical protein